MGVSREQQFFDIDVAPISKRHGEVQVSTTLCDVVALLHLHQGLARKHTDSIISAVLHPSNIKEVQFLPTIPHRCLVKLAFG